MLPFLVAAALAAAAPADLDQLWADALPRVSAASGIAVLAPHALPLDEELPLYGGGLGRARSWVLTVDALPDCGGANACFVASFGGRKGGRAQGRRRVALARGRHGRYTPLSCGASCAAATMEWRERGATYTIQVKVGPAAESRRALVALANEAIRSGPR